MPYGLGSLRRASEKLVFGVCCALDVVCFPRVSCVGTRSPVWRCCLLGALGSRNYPLQATTLQWTASHPGIYRQHKLDSVDCFLKDTMKLEAAREVALD